MSSPHITNSANNGQHHWRAFVPKSIQEEIRKASRQFSRASLTLLITLVIWTPLFGYTMLFGNTMQGEQENQSLLALQIFSLVIGGLLALLCIGVIAINAGGRIVSEYLTRKQQELDVLEVQEACDEAQARSKEMAKAIARSDRIEEVCSQVQQETADFIRSHL